tara:strand:+ start:688 stop:1398 length:711 start_codon:yes stop_codon:yes gene_type:complete
MSNKKSLLNENTIRRFMKLASIGPLTETFVGKIKEDEEEIEESKDTEEELEEGPVAYDREEELDEPALEEPALEEPPGEELGEPGGEEDLGDALTDMMQGIADVVERVAEEHGVDLALDVEGEEPEMGEEPGMELEPGLEGPEGLEGSEEVEGLEEEPSAGARRYTAMGSGTPLEESEEEATEELSEEELLERITQRVAARLTQEQKNVKAQELKESKINQLTNKIVDKIFASTKK